MRKINIHGWIVPALLIWLLLVVSASRHLAAAEDATPADKAGIASEDLPRESLPNCTGGNLSLFDTRGRVATVLVCMSNECPISNEYIPVLNRLAGALGPRGVQFVGIDPEADQSLAAMAKHARDFKLGFPFVKDAEAKVSRRLRFQVTPEVCVFGGDGKLVYRGRIDDRYGPNGRSRDKALTSDLERALEELLAGKAVSVAKTKPIGCPIQ